MESQLQGLTCCRKKRKNVQFIDLRKSCLEPELGFRKISDGTLLKCLLTFGSYFVDGSNEKLWVMSH